MADLGRSGDHAHVPGVACVWCSSEGRPSEPPEESSMRPENRAAEALYKFEPPSYYGPLPTYEQWVAKYSSRTNIWLRRARIALKAAGPSDG